MARSTAVEVPASTLPELAPTPATEVTFEDIAPPTLYVVQRTSKAVDAGRAKFGDIIVGQGADDPEAEVLYEAAHPNEGVLIYPLHMYKTWTWSDGDNLKSWVYGDGTPPAEAIELQEQSGKRFFRTYNFVVFVPDYDDEMPANFRLNDKSQRPAANKINYTTSRSGLPSFHSAFRVTAEKKSKGNNNWAVPVVVQAAAQSEHVAKADELYRLIIPGIAQRAAKADATAASQPSI